METKTSAGQPDVQQDSGTEICEEDLENEQLKNSVRGLMRTVPSSVAVITVASIDPDTKKPLPMGVAVSSLSTVSMNPPTIAFNIKEPSKTLEAIRAAQGHFRVHIPGASRSGANVVELFCRGNHKDAYDLRKKNLSWLFPSSSRKDVSVSASLAPQILNDSIQAAMECTVVNEVAVADHVILIAKVENIEKKTSKDPAIMYLNGRYMRPDGTMITTHEGTEQPAIAGAVRTLWDYPISPGEEERRDYMMQIKAIIKENPIHMDGQRDTIRKLEQSLPYPPQALGINLEPLIVECRHETKSKTETWPVNYPVLSDFYGRLTPSSRTRLLERVKALVASDTRSLCVPYRSFLHLLSISPGCIDVLPSDFMEVLRAEGLGDIEGQDTEFATDTIHQFEAIEHELRRHMRSMGYYDALDTPIESILTLVGKYDKKAIPFFKRAHSRLLVLTHPNQFTAQSIDIEGEVGLTEIRVVLSRVIYHLHVTSRPAFQRLLGTNWNDMLRQVHVNPTITGFDVEYFFAKIKSLYYSTRHFYDFAPKIHTMLDPWFSTTVSWTDLESRVRQFVQKLPLRATTWTGRDKLAALGLYSKANVVIPGQDDAQPLHEGLILDTLIAKELKNHYGNGSAAENEAIATFLKDTYNFEVYRKLTSTSRDLAPRLSSDETYEAMMANRNVDVMAKSRLAQEAQVAFKKQGVAAPKQQGRGQRDGERGWQSGDRPRIRSGNGGKARAPPAKQSGWTTYSLGGGKKDAFGEY